LELQPDDPSVITFHLSEQAFLAFYVINDLEMSQSSKALVSPICLFWLLCLVCLYHLTYPCGSVLNSTDGHATAEILNDRTNE
jgi:hypothetical protein